MLQPNEHVMSVFNKHTASMASRVNTSTWLTLGSACRARLSGNRCGHP